MDEYLQGTFVRMRSSNADLLRSFELSLVGILINCVRFKDSFRQSDADDGQSQFKPSRIINSESLRLCKTSEREEMASFITASKVKISSNCLAVVIDFDKEVQNHALTHIATPPPFMIKSILNL